MNAWGLAHTLMDRPVPNRDGWLTRCPAHDDRHPSLSIRDGENGRFVVFCFAGCGFLEIREALQAQGLWDDGNRPMDSRPRRGSDRSWALQHIFDESRELDPDGIAGKYLLRRGIDLESIPPSLREHPRLSVYEGGRRTVQAFPAILAVIQNVDGRPAGLHVTFLSEDGTGKAAIESPRRIIGTEEGSTRGGCVRLMDPRDGHIGLAEGLETTLSACLLTGIPGWSALTAGGLERAELPSEIRRVTIFADRDKAGLRAAGNACERFRSEGRTAEILVPNEWKMDFNDVLVNEKAQPAAN